MPVVNLYFGVYDTIVVVQAALILVAVVCQESKSERPLRDGGLAYVLLLLFVVPWFSQYVGRYGGVPVYTLLLMVMGFLDYAIFWRGGSSRE